MLGGWDESTPLPINQLIFRSSVQLSPMALVWAAMETHLFYQPTGSNYANIQVKYTVEYQPPNYQPYITSIEITFITSGGTSVPIVTYLPTDPSNPDNINFVADGFVTDYYFNLPEPVYYIANVKDQCYAYFDQTWELFDKEELIYDKYFGGFFGYNGSNWNVERGQLNTEAMYTDGIFFGKNGVETGSFFNVTNLNVKTIADKLNYVGRLTNITLDPNIKYFTFDTPSTKLNRIEYVPSINITNNVTNMTRAFSGMHSLKYIDSTIWNTSNVSNMFGCFIDCRNLITISSFDTRSVTDMSRMFSGCYNLRTVPEFNTSIVTNMSHLMLYCFNLIEVPNFNTLNVVNASHMFDGCSRLKSISNINTYKIQNASYMYSNCNNIATLPQSSLMNVTNASHMCSNSPNLMNFGQNLAMAKATDLSYMFQNCYNLVGLNLTRLDDASNMSYMFQNCYSLYNLVLNSIPNVTNMTNIFQNCTNLSVLTYANICNWLPMASNLTNQYLSNMGLNIHNFTAHQLQILNTRGYIDAIPNADYVYNVTLIEGGV